MLGNMLPVNRHFHYRREHAMADLKSRFEQAVADSKQLPEKPDNMTLLKIYALYKQASEGDVEGKRPGFSDMVGRAKWDAWNEAKGKSKDDAMQEYVDLIESLK
jgi:acyl-CoA-binding protein